NFLDRDMTIHGKIVETISKTFEANFNSRWASPIKFPKKPTPDDFRYRKTHNYYPQQQHSQYERDLKRWQANLEGAHQFLFEEMDITHIREVGLAQLTLSQSGTCNKLKFLSEVPSFGRKRKYGRILKELIRKKIESAQESIVIESPYFILTDEFKKVVDKTL